MGRPLLRTLKGVKTWKVTGTAFSRPGDNLVKVDLANLKNLPGFLDSIKPDVIVHSAAERRPDVSQRDPEGTRRLNVEATAAIAAWASANDAFMIYISTDYVFDGTTPPYSTDSPPNPINSYGESKRQGEIAVLSTCLENAILRVPILYGNVERLDESPVTSIAGNMLDASGSECIKVENWAIRYPTLTDDVAYVIREMLLHKEKHPSFKGIFHWSGNEAMTKYDMAKIFADYLNFDEARLTPVNSAPTGAPRPKNSQLDSSRLRSIGIERYTPFKDAIPIILKDVLKSRV